MKQSLEHKPVTAPIGKMDEPVPVHYRVVGDKDILVLKPLFDRLGWPLPDPEFAKVVLAEAGELGQGVIIGFVVIQFIAHAEPLWCHPGSRGSGVAEELARQATLYLQNDSHMSRFVCVCKPGSFAARLAEQNGYQIVPESVVYQKYVPENDKYRNRSKDN